MTRVARDAAVTDGETRRIDVLLLLLAPVLGIGGAGLRVTRIAAHLHDLARHLLVVRNADVAFPVDAEVARPGAIRVARIEDVLLVDLLVAGGARRLRHPPLRRHDVVVIGAVAAGARHLRRHLPRRKRDRRILPSRLAHGAGFELRDDDRVQLAVALRARLLIEHALRDVGAELRCRRRHRLQIGKDRPRVRVGDDLLVKRRHDAARVPQLVDEGLDRELRIRQRGADATAPAGAMTAQAAPPYIKVGPRGLFGRRRGRDDDHE